MKKFLLLIVVGAVFLLLGSQTSQAQEVVYLAGPNIAAQNLQGLGFSWADFDQNGTLDLFIEPDNLCFNKITSFTRAAASGIANQNMVGSICFDFNGDGYPDVLTTQGGVAPRLYVYNPVTAAFDSLSDAQKGDLRTITASGQEYGLAAADYNHDGYPDIAFAGGANATAIAVRLLKGSANGFVSVGGTSAAPVIDTTMIFESWNIHFVDANNDGWADLFVPSFRQNLLTGGSKGCVLFLNNKDGTFSPTTGTRVGGGLDTGLVVGDTIRHYSAIASAWGDFDNDGIMDLAISALGGEEQGSGFRLLKGNGNGTFTEVTTLAGITYDSNCRALSWGDYNNDGYVDLLKSRGFNPPGLWRNNGNGTFTEVAALNGIPSSGFNSRSVAFIDYNNDGWLDFLGVAGQSSALWMNTNGNTNNWIAFRPVGTGNNLSAIGARFTVYTNGGTKKQIRNIEAGGSGGATGGNVWAYFGIGLATTVDSVAVQWPDGSSQSFSGLAVNRYWTVKEGSVIPGAPVLATPANGATGQSSSLSLTWSPVTGAAAYHIQVSLNPDFADPTMVAVDDAAVTDASKAVVLGDATTYYWRVQSVNGGFTSAYSSVYSFTTSGSAPTTAPTLVAPADTAIDQPARISLKCSKVAGASQYHWQVSLYTSFSGFTIDDYTSADTARTVQLVSGRKYYWRVAAVNGAGASGFSTVQSFTVMTAPPTPTLVSPASNEQNVRADTLTLTWRAVARASKYVIQLARSDASFQLVVAENTVSAPDTTLQLVGLQRQTTYYWRVRAYNDGGTSLFTGGTPFVTIIAAPAKPATLGKPAANATDVNRQTTFTWALSVNAVKYRLQVALDNLFAQVVRDVIVYEDSTATLEVPLDATSDYFWHVSAGNIGGFSAYTDPRYFSTGTQMVVDKDPDVPGEFALIQNFPNPFNPSTTIPYEVPKAAHVRITIYDLLGREVATLVDGVLAANRYKIEWRASGFGSGVYFYRMDAKSTDGTGNFTSVKKLILMK